MLIFSISLQLFITELFIVSDILYSSSPSAKETHVHVSTICKQNFNSLRARYLELSEDCFEILDIKHFLSTSNL